MNEFIGAIEVKIDVALRDLKHKIKNELHNQTHSFYGVEGLMKMDGIIYKKIDERLQLYIEKENKLLKEGERRAIFIDEDGSRTELKYLPPIIKLIKDLEWASKRVKELESVLRKIIDVGEGWEINVNNYDDHDLRRLADDSIEAS